MSEIMRNVKISMFEDADLQRVHEYSLKILAENGVKISGKRALEIFKKHGFRVDGNQVYMTEAQVRAALETAPSHFVFHGLNPERSLDLGGGDYGVPGPIGPVNVQDLDGGIRRGTLQDVVNLIKIYQGSDVMTMNSNNGVEANDVDVKNRHLEIMRAILNHTDKPFYTKLFSYEQMHQAMDMIEIATGEKLQPGGKIYLSPGSAPSMSPLSYSSEVTDNIVALAERGQAVTMGTATSTGVTGPIQIFGTITLQNAEVLAGIVLAQLVNPGNAVGYGVGACPGNMRGAKYCCGSPGRVMLQVGSMEMAKRFYHLPARTIPYSTDALNVDIQCGIESYEGTMGNILTNADYQLSEIGTLDGLMTTSYEKTIIDEEITSRLLYIRNGIDVSEEASGLESILEIGSGGEYITSDDTLDYMHDAWYAKYTSWNIKSEDNPPGDNDYVLRRANAEWKRRLEEAPETLLDAEAAKELDTYVAKHSK
ncbi:MAG TPA: trimethylamine methyltransferase family protein [Candidatus Pelethocola excrementipullorum]|nr:trimethylamine methyltransferase family protein [Candidatus Pelethocola excrementipullorum]